MGNDPLSPPLVGLVSVHPWLFQSSYPAASQTHTANTLLGVSKVLFSWFRGTLRSCHCAHVFILGPHDTSWKTNTFATLLNCLNTLKK